MQGIFFFFFLTKNLELVSLSCPLLVAGVEGESPNSKALKRKIPPSSMTCTLCYITFLKLAVQLPLSVLLYRPLQSGSCLISAVNWDLDCLERKCLV